MADTLTIRLYEVDPGPGGHYWEVGFDEGGPVRNPLGTFDTHHDAADAATLHARKEMNWTGPITIIIHDQDEWQNLPQEVAESDEPRGPGRPYMPLSEEYTTLYMEKIVRIRQTFGAFELRFSGLGWTAKAGPVERREDGVRRSCAGFGTTPDQAVESLWWELTRPGGRYQIGGFDGPELLYHDKADWFRMTTES